jgi:hypothetical protein
MWCFKNPAIWAIPVTTGMDSGGPVLSMTQQSIEVPGIGRSYVNRSPIGCGAHLCPILQTADRGREPVENHLVASAIERVQGRDRMPHSAGRVEAAMHDW